jgi:hypothetical protein
MPAEDYRRALDAALREYEALTRERADLDARIAQLAQTVGSLTRLCGFEPTVPWGLTDACRMVLKAAGHPLTAVEVRAQLQAMGIDLSKYTNDLAVVHTILRRLNQSGETQFVPRAWDKPGYAWRPPVTSLAISKEQAEALRAGADVMATVASRAKAARKRRAARAGKAARSST